MTVIAELKNVTKAYQNKIAVNDVSLQIRQGEILALLGPNGSGKTTILKILALIENPTSGEVKFQDELVTAKNIERTRLQTTLVFQKTILFDTSVYSNIAYGLRIRKMPTDMLDDEVKRALRLGKLEGFEKRPARKLSGGEQQRVAIARASALKTKLLLLDEPTANLDPKNALIIEDAIATANREFGTTIVMATHNMFQARNLPHRIALVGDGKITEIGETKGIFNKLSRTLASFAALENTFVGKSRTSEDGTARVDIGDGITIAAASRTEGGVSVFVSPEDIIISKSPFASSARNNFGGKIVEIRDLGTLVKLRVDIGKLFAVQITKRSFEEMDLNLGMEVFLTFKASSVQLV
jgi:molybdopterin-binding protein